MRRTLFVFRRELLGVVIAAVSERVAEQERARLARDVERAGLAPDGAAWLTAAAEATLATLAANGEATSSQLRAAVPLLAGSIEYAPGKPYGGSAPVAPRVLTTLSAAGQVIRAHNQGSWTGSRPRWATTEHWLGEAPAVVPRPLAVAELVRRWLYAFGPATVTDLKWWLGSTLALVRTALADVGAVEVDVHGRTGVALPDDLEPVERVDPYPVLLPALDPTIMGWAERGWYLGEHRAQVFDTTGNAGPTAWWDGRVVGGWNQTPSGTVRLHLLEDVGGEAKAALEEEAARLSEWLGGVRSAPRFPSPLTRSANPGAVRR